MSDPITLAVLAGAAAGGAAGKFTEIAVGSGKFWIGKYFNNHQPKAQEKAQQNSLDFLVELSQRIQKLESEKTIPIERIEKAQEDPDFSATLQKAILVSAQTDNKDKHKLLAQILSERLCAESESLLTLVSKLAVDVISLITPNQLNILAFAMEMLYISPSTPIDSNQYTLWLRERYKPFKDVTISKLDIVHLESLSCLKQNHFMERNLNETLSMKNQNRGFDPSFLDQKIGKKISELWDKKIESVDLTSVGQLLGIHVSNNRLGTQLPLDYFN